MLFSTPVTMAATITWLTLLLPVVHAGWINNLQPRASGTPSSCTASCPDQDNAGYAVGNQDTQSYPIFCSYPTAQGEDPNDYSCIYNKDTGTLQTDNDAGHCPSSAPLNTCSAPGKRAVATKRENVAAPPQAAAAPINMRSLKGLQKTKHSARTLKALKMEKEME